MKTINQVLDYFFQNNFHYNKDWNDEEKLNELKQNLLSEQLPLQQGLKPAAKSWTKNQSALSEQLPLQQGLKHSNFKNL